MRVGRSKIDLHQAIFVRAADAVHMPLFLYRCPTTGYRVQGLASEDTSGDHDIYEPTTSPVFHRGHHVNPATGALLGERSNSASGSEKPRTYSISVRGPLGLALLQAQFEVETFCSHRIIRPNRQRFFASDALRQAD